MAGGSNTIHCEHYSFNVNTENMHCNEMFWCPKCINMPGGSNCVTCEHYTMNHNNVAMCENVTTDSLTRNQTDRNSITIESTFFF